MERITVKTLQAICDRLNLETGSPMESYTRHANGELRSNIGNYHLDQAYGGVTLARMMNTGGGITHPFGFGFFTRRECYHILHAYLRGIEIGHEPGMSRAA